MIVNKQSLQRAQVINRKIVNSGCAPAHPNALIPFNRWFRQVGQAGFSLPLKYSDFAWQVLKTKHGVVKNKNYNSNTKYSTYHKFCRIYYNIIISYQYA
ncbi:hypothetical protein Q765_00725 [Flavobacterium rivuli WB 3.3-2 = DSM 21788]|uniref:Uncharacterized protein n=1 Tax=Flavobacterium rivuli WB 3.3-2 = DSM 21788 TaxID=1121895 RepID=A0A0A2MJF2_9FLAO|nr:hypothetical protein Q765_00725 [Flavobacterium rivuli WB 3.3-2 = DSM 21788]